MILFMILVIMAIVLLLAVIFGVAIGGAGFILIFGDVIVCIGLIVIILIAIVRARS